MRWQYLNRNRHTSVFVTDDGRYAIVPDAGNTRQHWRAFYERDWIGNFGTAREAKAFINRHDGHPVMEEMRDSRFGTLDETLDQWASVTPWAFPQNNPPTTAPGDAQ